MVKRKKATEDIFISLLRHKVSTRRELEAETGYSWGMISHAIADLREEGLVEEGESFSDGNSGRNAKYVRPSSNLSAIGVDFGAGEIHVAVYSLEREVLFEKTFPNRSVNQEEALNALFEAVKEAKAHATGKVFSIGISCQGFVSSKEGLYLKYSFVPEWQSYPLAKEIEKRFGAPCEIANDMVCLARDAKETNDHEDNLSMIVRLGDGVGFAFLGQEDIKSDRFKGDYGHMIVEKGGLPCHCGKKGCLEAYSSIQGLLRRTGLKKEEREILFVEKDKYSILLTEAAEKIGLALINAISGFMVNRIIVTGEMLRFGQGFIDEIQKAYDADRGSLEPALNLEVRPELSPMRGACMLAIEKTAKKVLQS